ncbi:MAG: hypothetical protein ACI841_002565 [Planctomycetota bacterium]|jgi:hypothetical protein
MMTQENRTTLRFVSGLALTLALAACTTSNDKADPTSVTSVTQDLTADPDGGTIVVVFDVAPGAISAANFELESGDQAIERVSRSGNAVTIEFDDRVTPDYRLAAVGFDFVSADFMDIETTDDSAPTFTISSGTQDATALGGDSFIVTFDGPRVVADDVVDDENWALTVDSEELDLSDSTFSFDVETQIMTVALGESANLHATYTLAAESLTSVADVAVSDIAVAGTATGDAVAPTFVSAEQNLSEDEFGRVVDFTFSEPMDPVHAVRAANFIIDDHAGASGMTTATAISQPSGEIIRVTYSSPVVPGLDEVELSGIVDSHGNALPAGTEAITNSSPAVNGFDSVTATTTENEGGDLITVVTDQAFDPDLAIDDSFWTLTVGGSGITMADQTLTYSLEESELTIELDFDMQNGDAVVLTAVALPDVDGQTFSAADSSATASGDSDEPEVLTVTQNRSFDPTGVTIDVNLSEDVDETAAETIANWSLDGGLTILTAELLGGGNTVRLTADDIIVPVDITLTSEAGLEDLAGNVTGSAVGSIAIESSDTTEPGLTVVASEAVEGADDDTIIVTFDDNMIESEVEDDTNWTIESPTGTALDITGCTIDYNDNSRQATITLDAGDLALKGGDDVQAEVADMRDIAGNTVMADAVSSAIAFETNRPTVDGAWYDTVDTNEITVMFSEPCDELDDLYDASTNADGTRFALRIGDGGANDGDLRGYPTGTTVLYGGLGVTLEFGFLINTDDTIDILGVTDLAGNYMFPEMALDTDMEDADLPALDGSSTIAVTTGELNDVITVEFTEDMSPWYITSLDNYTLETSIGSTEQSLDGATLEFDGASTVTITMDSGTSVNLLNAIDYDLFVNVDTDNPLRTAQGLALAAQDTDASVTASGDSTAPTVSVSDARFHSVDDDTIVVIFDEAVDEDVLAASDFTYNAVAADSVSLISPRVLEVVWASSLTPGFSIDIQTASVSDLAGNVPGATITVAVTDDANGPLISSVTGTSVSGIGGDTMEIAFNEEVDQDSALSTGNYSLVQGVNPISLSGAVTFYDSTTSTVTIVLPDSSELDASSSFTLTISGVEDVAGNAMGTATPVGAATAGDSTAPSISSSFVNLREDDGGTMIDVLFSEDVDQSYVGDYTNWSTDGTAVVTAAEIVSPRHVRLTLDLAMDSADVIEITAVDDMGLNASGDLTSDPEE